MYDLLLKLIFKDSLNLLLNKIPRKIKKDNIYIRTDTAILQRIKDKYSNLKTEISNHSTQYDKTYKNNLKALLQLDTIEEIYTLINENKEDQALNVILNLFRHL